MCCSAIGLGAQSFPRLVQQCGSFGPRLPCSWLALSEDVILDSHADLFLLEAGEIDIDDEMAWGLDDVKGDHVALGGAWMDIAEGVHGIRFQRRNRDILF
jgi:hypothetical protein